MGPLTYHLELPPQWKIHNVFHRGLLHHNKEDTIEGRTPAKPPAVMVQGHEQHVIDQIVDTRWEKKPGTEDQYQYSVKIRWLRQGPEHDMWKPLDELNQEATRGPQQLEAGDKDDDLLERYLRDHPNALRPDQVPTDENPPLVQRLRRRH